VASQKSVKNHFFEPRIVVHDGILHGLVALIRICAARMVSSRRTHDYTEQAVSVVVILLDALIR